MAVALRSHRRPSRTTNRLTSPQAPVRRASPPTAALLPRLQSPSVRSLASLAPPLASVATCMTTVASAKRRHWAAYPSFSSLALPPLVTLLPCPRSLLAQALSAPVPTRLLRVATASLLAATVVVAAAVTSLSPRAVMVVMMVASLRAVSRHRLPTVVRLLRQPCRSVPSHASPLPLPTLAAMSTTMLANASQRPARV